MEKDVIREVERNLLIPVSNYEYYSGGSYHMVDGRICTGVPRGGQPKKRQEVDD